MKQDYSEDRDRPVTVEYGHHRDAQFPTTLFPRVTEPVVFGFGPGHPEPARSSGWLALYLADAERE